MQLTKRRRIKRECTVISRKSIRSIVAELTGTTQNIQIPTRAIEAENAFTDDQEIESTAPDSQAPSPKPEKSPRPQPMAPPNDDGAVASQIATLLRERGTLSNGEVQAATGLDAATVRAHLQALVAAGHARTEGQRRGMRYVAVEFQKLLLG